MPKASEIIAKLEELAPENLALEWDNSGLQVGNLNNNVKKILLAVEPTEEVIEEAIKNKCQLLLVHHPFIFNGLNSLDLSTARGKLIARVMDNDLTIYAAHTNLDLAQGGLNDFLAEVLDLIEVKNLAPRIKKEKIIVFVPRENLTQVQQALFAAGAGNIGDYAEASFYSKGIGTFKPLTGSNPAIGKQGRREEVQEYRLEAIFPAQNRQKIIESLLSSHPYEEPAFDILALQQSGQDPLPARQAKTPKAISLQQFLQRIAKKLSPAALRYSGDLKKQVSQVAMACGSGGDFIDNLPAGKYDLYISGDIKYHQVLAAQEKDIAVIDVGHFASEKIFKDLLANYLEEQLSASSVELIKSNSDKSPWKLLK